MKECGPGLKRIGIACVNCGAGTYTVEMDTATSCNTCTAGQTSVSPFTSCVNCTAGQSSTGSGGACTNCDTGTTSSGGGTCSNCAAGKSSSSPFTACVNCAAGQSSTGSGGACTNCDGGKYKTLASAAQCMDCPANSDTESLRRDFFSPVLSRHPSCEL